MSHRGRLRALANRLGVTGGYRSAIDERWVETPDTTREALVTAMGFACDSERAAEDSLRGLEGRARGRLLAPERVVRWDPDRSPLVVPSWPADAPPRVRYEVELELAPDDPDGKSLAGDGWLERGESAVLPRRPGPGVHRLRLRLAWPGGAAESSQELFVVPGRCVDVESRVGPAGAFGLWTHLYLLRSATSWGFGHFGDLGRLVDEASRMGAAFVGLNPLHALESPLESPCPYLPQSRLYRNPLYLEPERIPEWGESGEARALARDRRAAIETLRAADRLDAAAVERTLDPVLRALHAEFSRRHRDRETERGRAYARYLAREGESLANFATFRALGRHFRSQGLPEDWRRWPDGHRRPEGPEVEAFRRAHAEEIDFHSFLQFELDRQMSGLAQRSRERGLPIGLYTDLALGSHAGGSDVWAHGALFARGATVGAPPDAFSQQGQDWSFPPLVPGRFAEGGFGFWWRLVDGALSHAGALRIDHALALRRLFWIPEGAPASEGAYVAYPERELLGLLALASHRRDALVIGEDLGTIPEGFSEGLQERGVLSSRVMVFERDRQGFHPARSFPRRCLLTANTHDLAPLAALQDEEDLLLRRRVGQLPDDASLEREVRQRRDDRTALARRLREEGGLEGDIEPGEENTVALVAATTRFLCRSPAALVGLALDDLAGEREPINLPGVPPERHASWTRRSRLALEQIGAGPIARAALAAVPEGRRAPTRSPSEDA